MRVQLALIGALFAVVPSLAARAATTVAVSVVGAKGSAEDKLDAKVRGQLAARGLDVVSERALAKAAKKAKTEPDTVAAALEAGADLWISVSVKKVKKKFVAQGKLVDVKSGKLLKSVKRSYKKASSAAAIGDLIGTELAEAALGRESGGGEAVAGGDDDDDGEAADDDDAPKQQKAVRPKEEETTSQPVARATETSVVTPKDEDKATSASTSIERDGPVLTGGEDRVLHLLIGAGSQVTSAYTVAVGPQVTGLAYRLTPLILLDAGISVQIPNVGLGFELGLAFVPVKYQIEVDPAVMPTTPKGRFLDVGGGAFYKIALARFGEGEQSRFFIAPALGFQYSSLAVEAQEPYTVVLSWSAIAPYVGAKLGVVADALALELDARFKFIVSYGEAPESTGEGGSGTGVRIGAVVRYWMSDHFGVSLLAAYDFSRVSFSGEGSRTPFVDDPPLLDASAYSSDLRASVGVVLGL